jgi:hypothetical protein
LGNEEESYMRRFLLALLTLLVLLVGTTAMASADKGTIQPYAFAIRTP